MDGYPTILMTVDADGMSVILLTGGSSRRMGTDKASLAFGNDSLLSFHLEQMSSTFPVVVVGEQSEAWPEVTFIRENPIGTGPVAAVAAAMELVNTPVVLLLAVDTPFAFSHLLGFELGQNSHALIPRDPSGQTQYLAGIYRSEPLRRALAELGSPEGKSMRELISHLQSIEYRQMDSNNYESFMDFNTPEELSTAREYLRSQPTVMP